MTARDARGFKLAMDALHAAGGGLVADLIEQSLDMEFCHCGEPMFTYEDGFTRHLCLTCSAERCDAPMDGRQYSCAPAVTR